MNRISEVLELFKAWHQKLNNLKLGLTQPGMQQDILDVFLSHLELEITSENRYIVYSRLVDLKEESLLQYADKNNYNFEDKNTLIKKAYNYVKIFYMSEYQDIIKRIEEEDLLSDFYLQIIKSNFEIGLYMCDWHLAWTGYIIHDINVELEERFGSTKMILEYLQEHNLLEKDIEGNIADRSYSALVRNGEGYISKAYIDIFPLEIQKITLALRNTVESLEILEDREYNKKAEYIAYFNALIQAFEEKNIENLIEKWSLVDIAWMSIDTPFQIGHPLEFYEDLYRKSVAPEWDFRIQDTSILKSEIKDDISNMYEKLYDTLGRDNYRGSYEFSLKNKNRVQLYISNPTMVFGSELSGMFSAQVVPNDDRVSAMHGKKIFAYPEFILASHRSAPEFVLSHNTFEASFLNEYRSILNNKDLYYKVYDIETIGHEFGHTLWLDIGVEGEMNTSGNFKNIEEFKATAGGLAAYFMSENSDYDEAVLITHISRSVKMMKYREVEDIICYYTECLIHLEILFASGVIHIEENRIIFDKNNIKQAKDLYLQTYKKLIVVYLEKQDAGEFLYDYVVQSGKIFLPKNEKLRDFVEHYFSEYKLIGNKII